MDLVPKGKKDRVVSDSLERFKADKNHLKTGFIGTPYLCKALSYMPFFHVVGEILDELDGKLGGIKVKVD